MAYPAGPPTRVRFPVMLQSWQQLTFLHWEYDADIVRRLVPRHLELDTYEGRAWVSLTPFVLAKVRPPGLPALPWLSTAPETNVRTYVRGPGDHPGIWFFSLDIARLPTALAGRTAYALPYMWSDLRVRRDGDVMRYTGRRRWPNGSAGHENAGHEAVRGGDRAGPEVGYEAVVKIGPAFRNGELTDLDHFLTARYVLYTQYGPLAATAHVEHPPWPLARATVVRLSENLLASAGLPAPRGEPLVHFSPGVDVRIGPPEPRRWGSGAASVSA